jgi:hypothetical protein
VKTEPHPASPAVTRLPPPDRWPAPSAGPRPWRRGPVGLLGLGLCFALAALLAVLPAPPGGSALGALLALWLLPGYGLTGCLPWRERRPALSALLLIGASLGAAWLVLVGLVLVLLGAFDGPALLLLAGLTSLGPAAARLARGAPPLLGPRLARSDLWLLALVGLTASFWRLTQLGYSQFQGDEVEVVLRAAAVVQRLPEPLFYHGKGPAEVLVTAALSSFGQPLSEQSARLPFALFGLVATLGLSALAVGWFGLPVGLAAGLLLAFNGFFVAFAHLVQYQSLVFLLSVGALYAAERYRRPATRHPGWAVLAAVLVGAAGLAHYDGFFAGPPVALLIASGLGRSTQAWRAAAPTLALAALAGGLVLALFFVPYASSPLFALASERVSDRLDLGTLRNNWGQVWPLVRLYLSQLYALPLLVLAVIGAGLGLLAPAAWPALGGGDRRTVTLAAIVWALAPLLVALLLVRKPGTHVHVGFEALAVLAGIAVGGGYVLAGRRAARAALVGLALALLAPTAVHHAIFYLDAPAEVVRAGQVTRHPPFWRRGEQAPRRELFGFPYQAGWKAAGVLFADGTLRGSYDSNEFEQVTHWYARDGWRCTFQPRYYLIAEHVLAEIEPPRKDIAARYTQVGEVRVGGESRLRIFERNPASGLPRSAYRYEELAARFDQQLGLLTLDPGPLARGPVPRRYEMRSVDFGQVQLLGYRLLAEEPRPGGMLRLDLYWLPRTSGGGHEALVELGRQPVIGDGAGPGCDHSDSWRDWRAGQAFVQRHSIPIGDQAPAGRYPLRVGMRSAALGGPLPIVDGPLAGQTEITLAELDLQPAP